MKRLFAVGLAVGLLARVGSAVVIPVNCNLFFNGSNAVQIAWNAYPGKSYVIQTSTNLAQAWQNAPTTPATLTTTTNWLSYSFPVAAKAQFFKVVRLDTDGPEVYKTAPFDGAGELIAARRADADEFYEAITPPAVTDDAKAVMRQALAGMSEDEVEAMEDSPSMRLDLKAAKWVGPELDAVRAETRDRAGGWLPEAP